MRKTQNAALSSKKSKGAEALGIGFGSDKGMDAEDIKMMGGDDMMDGPSAGSQAASMGLADMDKPEPAKKAAAAPKVEQPAVPAETQSLA